MNNPTEQDVKNCLQCFFSEMENWDRDCYKRFQDGEWKEVGVDPFNEKNRQQLVAIFSKYCIQREAAARFEGTKVGFSGGEPEFIESKMEILSIELKGTVWEVVVQQKYGPRLKHRYRLASVGNELRIEDERDCATENSLNWSRIPL